MYIVDPHATYASNIMNYQSIIIKEVISSHLRERGISLTNQAQLRELIEMNIRRLKYGDNVAVEIDSEGQVTSVKKIDSFDCLNTVDEGAFIISYHELERFFNDQQSTTVEF